MHIEEVDRPVGKIDRREGVSPQIMDIARARSILPVHGNS